MNLRALRRRAEKLGNKEFQDKAEALLKDL